MEPQRAAPARSPDVAASPRPASRRKLWLDWQRGLAVLFMVEWHTYDAWRLDAVARGWLHEALNLVGGFAAPSFLYMAGMSQLLADAAAARKGVPVGERRARAVRRALWLLGVAYLFRIAEWMLGGAYRVPGGWQDILKVDVLNVIAVSLLASALLTVGLSARAHVAVAVAAAAAVALATPLVAAWQHPPRRVLDYLYATWPRANFQLFNWAAFCLAGSAAGRLALGEDRPWRFLGIGVALFAGGWLGDQLPPVYAHQDFWHTSPGWLAMRLGVVVAMSGALQLLPLAADRGLSWLRTLGRHSLLGYVVSVELPYGAASSVLHKALSMQTALWGIVLMIAATWAISVAADRWDAWRAARAAPQVAAP